MTMSGLALAGMSIPGFAAALAPGRDIAPLPLFSVLYDNGFPASAAFGAAAGQHGYATHDIDGDVTGFWMNHLAARWRHEPVAIAGLTHASALFVLERMGWDHGLRVVFRAQHRSQGNGRIEHRLAGPAAMLNAFEQAASEHPDLGACVAGMLSRCYRPEPAPSALAIPARPRPGQDAAADPAPLVSWVIAPRPSSASARNAFATVERIV